VRRHRRHIGRDRASASPTAGWECNERCGAKPIGFEPGNGAARSFPERAHGVGSKPHVETGNGSKSVWAFLWPGVDALSAGGSLIATAARTQLNSLSDEALPHVVVAGVEARRDGGDWMAVLVHRSCDLDLVASERLTSQ